MRVSPRRARRRSACGRSRSGRDRRQVVAAVPVGVDDLVVVEHDVAATRSGRGSRPSGCAGTATAGWRLVAHVADGDADLLARPRARPHPRATRPARRTRRGTSTSAPATAHRGRAAPPGRAPSSPRVTSVIIAGATRGNADSPHAGQSIARSPAPARSACRSGRRSGACAPTRRAARRGRRPAHDILVGHAVQPSEVDGGAVARIVAVGHVDGVRARRRRARRRSAETTTGRPGRRRCTRTCRPRRCTAPGPRAPAHGRRDGTLPLRPRIADVDDGAAVESRSEWSELILD